MADIRIKDLAVTAGSSASDDYLAVDGSTNGTRKLSAYSPTFGGNLTVSGAGTSSVAGSFGIGTTALSNYGGTFQVKGRQAWLPSTWTNSSTNYLAWMNVDDSTNTFYIQTLQNNGTNSGFVSIQPNGGNVLIGTTTDRGRLTINKTASDTLSTANAAAFIGQPDNLEAGLLMQQTATTPYSFVLQGRSPSGVYQFPISLNPQGGNVLIGTTTDSGGIIQAKGSAKLIGATTEDVSLDMGVGRSGNGNAFIDLVGDATYTDYGLRIIRGNTGANAGSAIKHRGTGVFDITCIEGAAIQLVPEPGVDNYIGYGSTRDTYLTAKATGTHNLRDATGANWWTFDRNKTFIVNTTSAPGSNPTGGGYLYVESGALKYRGSSGTVTTIANA